METKIEEKELKNLFDTANKGFKFLLSYGSKLIGGYGGFEKSEYDNLNLDDFSKNDPYLIIKSIRNILDLFLLEQIELNKEKKESSLLLGTLYNFCLKEYLNWDLNFIKDKELVVLSKDKKWMIISVSYIYKLLTYEESDNDLLLFVNMIKDKKLPRSKKDYTAIMS